MFKSFYEMFGFMKKSYSGKTAFQWVADDGKTVLKKSFDELVSDVFRFAGYIKATEPQPAGKHFGILAGNSYHYGVCIGGILCAGGVVTLLNQMESVDNITYQAEYADVCRIFADGENAIRLFSFCEKRNVQINSIEDYKKYNEAVVDDVVCDTERLAFLLFTSGSSGKSKCVMLSGKNVFTGMECSGCVFKHFATVPHTKPCRFLLLHPLCHIMSFIFMFEQLIWGHQINCCNIKKLYRDMQLMDSDITCTVPVVLNQWYNELTCGNKRALGGISQIICGGAALKSEQIQLFEDNGIHIAPSYGLSESSCDGTYNIYYYTKKANSVGKPCGHGVEINFDNGEICLSGDPIMMGYYKNKAATDDVIIDGWLHTGDLGYMDEDGDLYITGRKKNLIILSNGENVSPEELEQKIAQNPAVKEVIVKGKNDAICAVIFCNEEQQQSIKNFIDELNRTLPMFKQITEVEFCSEPLPRTANGKIIRS